MAEEPGGYPVTIRQDIESERAVLSAFFSQNSLFRPLPSGFFSIREYDLIYEAQRDLIESGHVADTSSVYKILAGKVDISSIVGCDLPSAGNFQFYLQAGLETWSLRQLQRLSDYIENDREDLTSADLVSKIESILERVIEQGLDRESFVHVGRACELFQKRLDDRISATDSGHRFSGVPSGFEELDQMTDGFQNQEFICMLGKPSTGKTAASLSFIESMTRSRIPVGFFSCEMGKESLIDRMIANIGMIDAMRLKRGILDSAEMVATLETRQQLEKRSIWIDDTPNIDLDTFRHRARGMKRRGCRIIFLDYIQLVTVNENIGKAEKIGLVSKTMKAMARELDIPVVALSQVNKEDKAYFSSEIEQDADIMIYLQKDEDESKKLKMDIIEVDVKKNRNGLTGSFQVQFDKRHQRFEEL